MYRRLFLTGSALAVVAVAYGGHAAEIAVDTPEATIATLQRGLIDAASAPATATLEQRYRALEPVIVATHNLPYIAEFALRRQWGSIAEADRRRYVTAFQRLSIMTYAARFKAVGADTFRALAAAPADSSGRVEVSTAVKRADQPDVSLEYLLQQELQQDEQAWRIINVVADGVSDLALKRAEYQRVFASAGIDGLVAEIEAQTQRLTQD
jgi:phospholipid transport system substrate-binding protein